jgi:hypothetical protein
MKRIFRPLSIAFAVVLMLASLGGASAAGLPGSYWWTSIQFQNVSSGTGHLSMIAYPQDNSGSSTTYSSDSFTFNSGSGLTYNPGYPPNYSGGGNRIGFCASASTCNSAPDDTLPAGFSGSVIASADVSTAAVVMVANSLNGSVGNSSGHAGGYYTGMGTAASSMLFPVAKHNFGGNTVAYYVQAIGADAVTTMTYTMNDASTHTESVTIPANRMHLFDPANATPPVASSSCGSAATSPCLGTATLAASSGQVAGIALEFPQAPPSGYAVILGASRGFTPSDYSTTIVAPIFKNDFPNGTTGNYSGWVLQNTTGSTATVSVTLTVVGSTNPSAPVGTVYTQPITIPANGQVVLSKFRGNIGGMPAGVVAAGVATSNQPLVAVSNESNSSAAVAARLTTYNCFNPSAATTEVAAPVVKEFFPGGIAAATKSGTSVTVMNVGGSNASIMLKYVAVGGSGAPAGTTYYVTIGVGKGAGGTQLLAPNASYVFNMVSDPSRAALYAPTNGSLTLPVWNVNYAVTVTADQNIIALMQEDQKTTGTPNDFLNYEGFNLTP